MLQTLGTREANSPLFGDIAVVVFLLVLYILARWTAAGEDPQDFAAFDRIRTELNTAAPAFSRLSSPADLRWSSSLSTPMRPR